MGELALGAWPHLLAFNASAVSLGLRVWLFGSALRSRVPRDLDVLVLYRDREAVQALREERWWGGFTPPLDIIAMTDGEEQYYRFIEGCRAIHLR